MLKPFVGIYNHGSSDAAVIKPLNSKGQKAIAISCGINPRYSIDPYHMALSAIDEAVRNAVAVGANPEELSLLDNFCWGNPNLPDRLGSLVKAAEGCLAGALHYQVPFISGKDSLNNEYISASGERKAIPGTLLISAMAMVPDIEQVVTMDLKKAGNLLYILGFSRDELGGSLLLETLKLKGGKVPSLSAQARERALALHQVIAQGLVQSCHDLSEGGLAVAAAEMVIAGGVGLELQLANLPSEALSSLTKLFAESNTRWLLEVDPKHVEALENHFKTSHVPHAQLGHVSEKAELNISHQDENLIHLTWAELDKAWRGHVLEVSA
ncbi:MAG: AIR synthase-related protein [Deinococcales bacterium]